jgi:uncharacterized protein (DUF2147 family)
MKRVAAALTGLIWLSAAATAGAPEGVWLSEDGGTKVQIAHCGGKLCGKVVWLDEPNDPRTGKPKTDKLNPDPAKRARPLLGLQVVRGLSPDGDNRWSGLIYNADDGRTYEASLRVPSDSVAQVKGCVLKILCKQHTWTRTN